MPFNGAGTFTTVNTFVPNTTISSSAVNTNFSDVATGLSDCLTRDGQAGMTAPFKASSGSSGVPSITFTADATTGLRLGSGNVILVQGGADIGGLTATPIGTVVDFAGSSAPSKWLLCYGQAVSRTTYALLFSAISTAWGAGDGVNTFNVPDLRGRGTYGKDDMGGVAASRITNAVSGVVGTTLGATGGNEGHTLSAAEMPTHSHTATVTDPGHIHGITGSDGNGGNVIGQTGAIRQAGSSNGGNFSTLSINTGTTGISVSNSNAGSGSEHTVLNPAAIMNKIIFAGV